MTKRPSYQELHNTVQLLLKRIESMEAENMDLRERLARYENPKNSRNSSIPPSRDENRPKRNQSLRKVSGKKPGGQKGRKGNTLKIISNPDTVVKLQPHYCRQCGSSLEVIEAIKEKSRQIIDIPIIKASCTEYQVYSKTCNCGCQNVADFPNGVNAPISYGENIEALTGYFHARQYLPFARMQEVFNKVFNINISEGGIHCLLKRLSKKATPIYDKIGELVSESFVVGSDETGAKVNGDKQWFWTWQTNRYTYISHSINRKQETIKSLFPKGFPKSTLVHDGWKPQINTTAKYHQTCLPHLQRHLNYLNELYKTNKWGVQFLQLLYEAMDLKKKMKSQDYKESIDRDKVIEKLNLLLLNPPDKADKKLYTFFKRMCREKESLLTFMFIQGVPSDNNASERAIRNIKVKQKVSGQFKLETAAQNFAVLRSVIDTTIKNGQNVIYALSCVAKLSPNSLH